MDFPFGETVEHLDGTALGEDGDGNDVRTYPVKATYPNAGWNPGTSTEVVQGMEQVQQSPQFFLPPGIVVAPVDRLRRVVNGYVYDVVGEPGDYVSPFTGWAPGVVVNAKRVTG